MTLFNRYGNCRGITLFRWGSRNAELWYFPSGTVIPPHTHDQENIEVMFLLGNTTFYRVTNGQQKSFQPKWYHFGKLLSVPKGAVHWFIVGRFPLFAINFAHFLGGEKAKSASVDFTLTRGLN